MPTTLYGTFPILLPGTTESVSRNGLKKTSGTILLQTGQEADAQSLAEDYGSIFPAPQIRTTDMGLLEMSFDAYDDTGTPSQVKGSLLVKLSKTFTGFESVQFDPGNGPVIYYRPNSWTVNESWFVDTVTILQVIAATANSGAISTPSLTLSKTLKSRTIFGVVGGSAPWGSNNVPGATELNITWNAVIADVSRRNFGNIDEADVTYALEATVN
jgi:hypothetical protein